MSNDPALALPAHEYVMNHQFNFSSVEALYRQLKFDTVYRRQDHAVADAIHSGWQR